MPSEAEKPAWTFFTNHGHVLVCLASDPQLRTRDISALVGITERSAQGIISDLDEAGYITKTKDGRRNRYEIHRDRPMRHPLEQDHSVGDLLGALDKKPSSRPPKKSERR